LKYFLKQIRNKKKTSQKQIWIILPTTHFTKESVLHKWQFSDESPA
jgi:hypothetical protein